MKLDTTLDRIQEMVMDSHLQAIKALFDEIAESMTELKLKTDVNREFRSAEDYAQEPEPESQPSFVISAPWVEELLNQSKKTEDSELRAELEAQKQKQLVIEAKLEEMAADQKLMKEQHEKLLKNQVQADSKMDTMLEILMGMQKKP